jgi:hypothetical protein
MARTPPWPLPSSVPVSHLGLAGIIVGALGSGVGFYALFALDIYPVGWVTFIVSFILLLMSALYTMAWSWNHIPYPEVTPPQVEREVIVDGDTALR